MFNLAEERINEKDKEPAPLPPPPPTNSLHSQGHSPLISFYPLGLMSLKLPFLYSTWSMNKGEKKFSVFSFVSALFTFSHFFVAIFVDGTIITFRSIKYEHAWQDA
jgi:hypothetical protein